MEMEKKLSNELRKSLICDMMKRTIKKLIRILEHACQQSITVFMT